MIPLSQALISQRAVQKFRRDRDDMDDVKKRLEELMCGEWTDNNAKMLTTQESKGCRVPLYEIRVPTYCSPPCPLRLTCGLSFLGSRIGLMMMRYKVTCRRIMHGAIGVPAHIVAVAHSIIWKFMSYSSNIYPMPIRNASLNVWPCALLLQPPKDLRVIWQVEYTFLPQVTTNKGPSCVVLLSPAGMLDSTVAVCTALCSRYMHCRRVSL